MDVEPLFCAEQIQVPDGLAQVLKAFAKETIRRAPKDLLQFSAAYFTHLAETASNGAPIALSTLRALYQKIQADGDLNMPALREACLEHSIDLLSVEKLTRLKILGDTFPAEEAVVLLIASQAKDLYETIENSFIVMGNSNGALSKERVMKIVKYLARVDRNLTPDTVRQVEAEIDKNGKDTVDVDDLKAAHFLPQK